MCAECAKRAAETNDGRFCEKCQKRLILNEYNSLVRTRDLSRRGTEEIGRSARDPQALGGSAELNDWEDEMDPDPGLNVKFGKRRGFDK
tara:strand:+ start:213 stop:479 length:267 start_codon:yes stop_codon:yes gene_type:complete